ncbi:MAG TPA: hypothetical protein VK131_04760 [Candidatus Acidoferrales bacterium]|nr:hypothetical protein [Candidatus Acidoferrales bacterium]
MTGLSSSVALVFITTFGASAVEAIEMVTIVLGVGAIRGWRSTLAGTGAGLLVLAASIVVLGLALSAIPINVLRLVVGTLLLVFGLQWYRKGIRRVAARGLAGIGEEHFEGSEHQGPGLDWTAFTLAFKGVVLEGLEIAIIVVSFGASARQLRTAVVGGAAALAAIALAVVALKGVVTSIPRSLLQLIVGTLLTTFGSFWALEGLGVEWPAGDGAILGLLALYALAAAAYVSVERRRLFGFAPGG